VAAKTKFVSCHLWDFSGVTGRWDYGFLWASFSLCKYLNIAEIPGTHFLSTYPEGVVPSVEFWILKGWAGSSNYGNRLTYKQRAEGFKDCVCHRQNNRRRADMWYTSRTFAHRRRSAPIISLYYFKNRLCTEWGKSGETKKDICVSGHYALRLSRCGRLGLVRGKWQATGNKCWLQSGRDYSSNRVQSVQRGGNRWESH